MNETPIRSVCYISAKIWTAHSNFWSLHKHSQSPGKEWPFLIFFPPPPPQDLERCNDEWDSMTLISIALLTPSPLFRSRHHLCFSFDTTSVFFHFSSKEKLPRKLLFTFISSFFRFNLNWKIHISIWQHFQGSTPLTAFSAPLLISFYGRFRGLRRVCLKLSVVGYRKWCRHFSAENGLTRGEVGREKPRVYWRFYL